MTEWKPPSFIEYRDPNYTSPPPMSCEEKIEAIDREIIAMGTELTDAQFTKFIRGAVYQGMKARKVTLRRLIKERDTA